MKSLALMFESAAILSNTTVISLFFAVLKIQRIESFAMQSIMTFLSHMMAYVFQYVSTINLRNNYYESGLSIPKVSSLLQATMGKTILFSCANVQQTQLPQLHHHYIQQQKYSIVMRLVDIRALRFDCVPNLHQRQSRQVDATTGIRLITQKDDTDPTLTIPTTCVIAPSFHNHTITFVLLFVLSINACICILVHIHIHIHKQDQLRSISHIDTRIPKNKVIIIKHNQINTPITITSTMTCGTINALTMKQWVFFVNKDIVVQMDILFHNVIEIHFLHHCLVLLMIPQLIQIIFYQLLMVVTVLIDILHFVIVIDIAVKMELHVLTRLIFYYVTRVFLLLLLLLLSNRILKTIEISMDIGLIQLNYNLIQVLICLFAFNCIITSIHCLKQLLFTIDNTNNKMEFFLCFLGGFFVVFDTAQDGYKRKNGSQKATNTSLIKKPNGRIVNIIIIDEIQALLARLILIQAITSIVFNMVLHIIDIIFERKSSLDMKKHQNIFFNHYNIYTLLSQQKCYKSSYIVLQLIK